MHADVPLNPVQRQVLYGGMLGDSYLTRLRDKHRNSTLQLKHSFKQAEYVQWKYSVFRNYCRASPRIGQNGGWGGPLLRFSTLAYPCFTRAREVCYINGRKTITMEWLAKITTPLGLAVWYMDDGSLQQARWVTRIATNAFSQEEHVLIQEWLSKKWGINPIIRQDPRGTGYYLELPAQARDKFFDLIRPYIHPSMAYKINVPPIGYETCPVCQRRFTPRRNIRGTCLALHYQMYCSVKCRKYAGLRRRFNPQPTPCRICGATFTPHIGHQVTCGPQC